jgi:hypothetical protein
LETELVNDLAAQGFNRWPHTHGKSTTREIADLFREGEAISADQQAKHGSNRELHGIVWSRLDNNVVAVTLAN